MRLVPSWNPDMARLAVMGHTTGYMDRPLQFIQCLVPPCIQPVNSYPRHTISSHATPCTRRNETRSNVRPGAFPENRKQPPFSHTQQADGQADRQTGTDVRTDTERDEQNRPHMLTHQQHTLRRPIDRQTDRQTGRREKTERLDA
mmetsp:Transcript_18658/g.53463  ORF Transcript_18658/g.53463 Transcript_18658/m.53463 type:complete len:145 (+) Transcript_18658:1-435(+)